MLNVLLTARKASQTVVRGVRSAFGRLSGGRSSSALQGVGKTLILLGSLQMVACRIGDPEPPVVPGGEGLTPAQRWVAAAGSPETPADVRRAAVHYIAGTSAGGEAAYVDLYRAVLNEAGTDATVAAACALALARHGGPQHGPDIAGLLSHPTPYTRWQAAIALQRLQAPTVAGDLARSLNDEDADVRTAAAVALGRYPRRDVFDALLRALEDPDFGVARAAERSLSLITGHAGGDDPVAWQQHAEVRGADLFADAQPYTYRRYDGPGGLFGGGGVVVEGAERRDASDE